MSVWFLMHILATMGWNVKGRRETTRSCSLNEGNNENYHWQSVWDVKGYIHKWEATKKINMIFLVSPGYHIQGEGWKMIMPFPRLQTKNITKLTVRYHCCFHVIEKTTQSDPSHYSVQLISTDSSSTICGTYPIIFSSTPCSLFTSTTTFEIFGAMHNFWPSCWDSVATVSETSMDTVSTGLR